MSKVSWAALTAGSLLAGIVASGGITAVPGVAATPPPTPPPLNTPATPGEGAATPIPIPSGFGLPGESAPAPAPSGSASPTPPPDARKGLEGVWEVELQRGNKTQYGHMILKQSGTTLSGVYLDDAGKRFPLSGSVDGQAVRLVVSMPDSTTLLLEARLDGTTDMVGMLTSAQEQVAFTAAYRPKEKFIDNLNAAPGGMGGMGQGGGGYGPP
jgi:hypothetical protein